MIKKNPKHTTILSLIIHLFWIFFGYNLVAQNQPPVVTNVHFSQRSDCSYKVDIYYDLSDPDGNAMTVTMKASNDNGTTWTYSCPSLIGNIGAGQTSGTNKHIIWDFGTDHPDTFDTDFKIKIIADDGLGGMGQPCPGLPSFTYGGQTYNTVQIGTQCWMNENLNIGIMINGSSIQTNNGTMEKYCYNNDPSNCTIYGGLYQWNEVMQYTTTEGTQGICPFGWHIPTHGEYCNLAFFLDPSVNCSISSYSDNAGGMLKETGTAHWQSPNYGATNESGFTALGAGYKDYVYSFQDMLWISEFWTSTIDSYNSSLRVLWEMEKDYAFFSGGVVSVNHGSSVRCIKNQ